jgi:hypothetical protein
MNLIGLNLSITAPRYNETAKDTAKNIITPEDSGGYNVDHPA